MSEKQGGYLTAHKYSNVLADLLIVGSPSPFSRWFLGFFEELFNQLMSDWRHGNNYAANVFNSHFTSFIGTMIGSVESSTSLRAIIKFSPQNVASFSLGRFNCVWEVNNLTLTSPLSVNRLRPEALSRGAYA